MFKSKKQQNVELFTPLLQDSQRSDMKTSGGHEEIDMELVGDGLNNPDIGDRENLPTTSKTNEKLASLMEERKRLASERKRSRIFEFNSGHAAKRPDDYKYYIISVVVPLIVLSFMLVILFAFVVSPIIQGINATSGKENTDESHHQEGHEGHRHDLPASNTSTLSRTTADLKQKADSPSSSVKKDGDDKSSDHDHHHPGND